MTKPARGSLGAPGRDQHLDPEREPAADLVARQGFMTPPTDAHDSTRASSSTTPTHQSAITVNPSASVA
jgi:hypothetical protein